MDFAARPVTRFWSLSEISNPCNCQRCGAVALSIQSEQTELLRLCTSAPGQGGADGGARRKGAGEGGRKPPPACKRQLSLHSRSQLPAPNNLLAALCLGKRINKDLHTEPCLPGWLHTGRHAAHIAAALHKCCRLGKGQVFAAPTACHAHSPRSRAGWLAGKQTKHVCTAAARLIPC